ncbi:MAG: sigma-70 family RNA polymerase sigma factor, partial [Lachnospiraceae bacterium]|nr:sigma-70 family RNA polymerase sigma factor [Lachnospiraceae bacterium]
MNGEDVVRTYSDMVYRIALGYARNKEDAEDIYGETFLRL